MNPLPVDTATTPRPMRVAPEPAVALAYTPEVARATAPHMEYPYPDSLDRRVEL